MSVAMWAAVSLSTRSAFDEINFGKNLTKYNNALELESRVSSPRSDSARASWRAVYSFIGGLRAGNRWLYVSASDFIKDARYEAYRANAPMRLFD